MPESESVKCLLVKSIVRNDFILDESHSSTDESHSSNEDGSCRSSGVIDLISSSTWQSNSMRVITVTVKVSRFFSEHYRA